MRLAARTDRNHGDIVGLYRELGCSVHDTSRLGFGFPDIVIGIAGKTFLVEIKFGDEGFTAAQKVFHRDWRGEKPEVIRDREGAIAHVQRVRKAIQRGIP